VAWRNARKKAPAGAGAFLVSRWDFPATRATRSEFVKRVVVRAAKGGHVRLVPVAVVVLPVARDALGAVQPVRGAFLAAVDGLEVAVGVVGVEGPSASGRRGLGVHLRVVVGQEGGPPFARVAPMPFCVDRLAPVVADRDFLALVAGGLRGDRVLVAAREPVVGERGRGGDGSEGECECERCGAGGGLDAPVGLGGFASLGLVGLCGLAGLGLGGLRRLSSLLMLSYFLLC